MYITKDMQLGKRAKKGKKPSRKTLVRKADEACKLYIKEKYHWKCVVCGATKDEAPIGWGHLKTSAVYFTRWNEDNLAAQCNPCNGQHERDPYPYDSWYIRTYGLEHWDKLNNVFRNRSRPIKDWELIMIADYYKAKLEDNEVQPPDEIRELVVLR